MKPMLAATVEQVEHLDGRYPLMASPKLDGIRALIHEDELVSRNLKRIPNEHTQGLFNLSRLPSLDGELIVGNPWDKDCFRNTTSGVMCLSGEPNVSFYVFDYVCRTPTSFKDRYERLKLTVKQSGEKKIKVVPHVMITDALALYEYEQQMLDKGFEGVMLRNPDGVYKFGRSTFREGHLMKLKRFMDSEAEILELEELQHNENEQTKDELGRSKRSSHKAGKVAGQTLGSVRVRDIHSGGVFNVGSGFDEALRKRMWREGKKYVGEIIRYKYFPTGSKDKPRFPVFLGFRDRRDMD